MPRCAIKGTMNSFPNGLSEMLTKAPFIVVEIWSEGGEPQEKLKNFSWKLQVKSGKELFNRFTESNVFVSYPNDKILGCERVSVSNNKHLFLAFGKLASHSLSSFIVIFPFNLSVAPLLTCRVSIIELCAQDIILFLFPLTIHWSGQRWENRK